MLWFSILSPVCQWRDDGCLVTENHASLSFIVTVTIFCICVLERVHVDDNVNNKDVIFICYVSIFIVYLVCISHVMLISFFEWESIYKEKR